MQRALFGTFLILLLSGCLAQREGLKPLPENLPPPGFEEMLGRARAQASAALDAFYVDNWTDLEQAAVSLEQTARLLPRSTRIPDALKIKLDTEADLLKKDAGKLLEAARAKNSMQANEMMQRIQLRIRELHPNRRLLEKAPEVK
jgi:hypothetical protein